MFLSKLSPKYHLQFLRNTVTLTRLLSSSQTSHQRVLLSDLGDGIAHVEFNRPEKYNALDISQFEAIAKVANDLRRDKSIRVIIVSGKGKGFCSGLDVKSIIKPTQDHWTPWSKIKSLMKHSTNENVKTQSMEITEETHDEIQNEASGNLAQDVGYLWRQIQVPVIASIHGVCYGGGLQIALGCDVRYTTPDCKFSIMETKWGMIPDMSASVTLRELVRIDVAKELTFTGRIVDGLEAMKLGLVTKVCDDPFDEAIQMAKLITSRSPDSIAAAKVLFQSTWVVAPEKECLKLETKLQKKVLSSFNTAASSAQNFGLQVPYVSRKDFKDE